MKGFKILLIEDEKALGEIIKDSLGNRNFDVIHLQDSLSAYETYISEKPDALILDVMLPSGSGLNIARKVRLEDKHTPIIFLTARNMPADVLHGFEAGGNDYLKKPFDMEELIVRLKVLLNQNHLFEDENSPDVRLVEIGEYIFDIMRHTLVHQGALKQLSARESEVLKVLYQYRNRLLPRKAFLMQVWGDDDFFSSRTLDVYISRLRGRLKADPSIQIMNVRGFGYKLVF